MEEDKTDVAYSWQPNITAKTDIAVEEFEPLREKEERAQVIIPYWHWNDKETER